MQKVMGGEFRIEYGLLHGEASNEFNIKYSSGREALFTILNSEHALGNNTMLIPNYLCNSITRTIKEAGWKYFFYSVGENFKFNFQKIIKDKNINAVLLINYFGMIDLEEDITRIKENRPDLIVIEDDVQAFYEYRNSKADYSFTSLRKWFPCSDGAFINTDRKLKEITTFDSKWSQYKFAGNILKNYTNVDDSICLELLQKGEDLLDEEYHSSCSKASQKIFSNINLENVADIRRKNAKYLHEELLKLNVKHIFQEDAVPLFIPIFIENRGALREKFFKNDIFTPVHWTVVSDELNDVNDIYDRELSLICDQRYDLEDMKRQITVLKQFLDNEEF